MNRVFAFSCATTLSAIRVRANQREPSQSKVLAARDTGARAAALTGLHRAAFTGGCRHRSAALSLHPRALDVTAMRTSQANANTFRLRTSSVRAGVGVETTRCFAPRLGGMSSHVAANADALVTQTFGLCEPCCPRAKGAMVPGDTPAEPRSALPPRPPRLSGPSCGALNVALAGRAHPRTQDLCRACTPLRSSVASGRRPLHYASSPAQSRDREGGWCSSHFPWLRPSGQLTA